MFGEMTLVMLLQAAALLAAGGAAGYFLALQVFDKQRDKLKDELENARNELQAHRKQVDEHFLKTGLLFNRLTDNYREIYEHLANGAQTLCSPEINKPQLEQPETRVLPVGNVDTMAETADSDSGESETELAAGHTPHPDVETATAEGASQEAEKGEAAGEETVSREAGVEAEQAAAEAETEGKPEAGIEAGAVQTEGAEATEETAGKAGAEAESKSESELEAKSESELEAKSESELETKSESEAETQPEAEAEAGKPDAAEVAVAGGTTTDDTHVGADATPAPRDSEEKQAPGPAAAIAGEGTPDVDRHRSPPSIH